MILATFLVHALLSSLMLGLCAWASNAWPGDSSLWRAALGRFVWWGLPFGVIVLMNDAPLGNACIMAVAAWLGAWIPKVECPDIRVHWTEMTADLVVLLCRTAALLALPAAVFWLCGASWEMMVLAATGVIPCVYAGNAVHGIGRGLHVPGEVANVLLGADVGFWLTVAVMVPTPWRDYLP